MCTCMLSLVQTFFGLKIFKTRLIFILLCIRFITIYSETKENKSHTGLKIFILTLKLLCNLSESDQEKTRKKAFHHLCT